MDVTEEALLKDFLFSAVGSLIPQTVQFQLMQVIRSFYSPVHFCSEKSFNILKSRILFFSLKPVDVKYREVNKDVKI